MPDSPITTAVRLLREDGIERHAKAVQAAAHGFAGAALKFSREAAERDTAADALLLLCSEPDEATVERVARGIALLSAATDGPEIMLNVLSDGFSAMGCILSRAAAADACEAIARAALRALAQEQADDH